MSDLVQFIVPAATGILGVVSSSFWVSRWVRTTDAKLDKINRKLTDLQVSSALNTQTQTDLKIAQKAIEDRVAVAEKTLWSFQRG